MADEKKPTQGAVGVDQQTQEAMQRDEKGRDMKQRMYHHANWVRGLELGGEMLAPWGFLV